MCINYVLYILFILSDTISYSSNWHSVFSSKGSEFCVKYLLFLVQYVTCFVYVCVGFVLFVVVDFAFDLVKEI